VRQETDGLDGLSPVLGANLGAGYSVGQVDVLDHVRQLQGRCEARLTGAAVGFIDVK
jgi:hypothetical protein